MLKVNNIGDCIKEICNFPTTHKELNISPIEFYKKVRYKKYYNGITLESISEYVKSFPDITAKWLMYTEDKRQTGSWGLQEKNGVYKLFYYPGGSEKITEILLADRLFATSLMIRLEMECLRINEK